MADGTISSGATVAAANEWAGCVAAGAKDVAADGMSPAEAAAGGPVAAVVVAAAVVAAAGDVARRRAECAAAEDAVDDHRDDWRHGWCLTYECHWPRTMRSPRSEWPTGCASGAATDYAGS